MRSTLPLTFLFFCFMVLSSSAEDFWNSDAWKTTNSGKSARFTPLDFDLKDFWYGSHFFRGADWTRIGKTWMHPGTNAPAVLVFTAPKAGNVSLRGTVRKLHIWGDGIEARIELDRDKIWEAKIGGQDGTGASYTLSYPVKEGSQIRFILSSGPTIECDTTAWNPEIAYGDEIFTAAEGFAEAENAIQAGKKPNSPWSWFREDPSVVAGEVTQDELDLLCETLRQAVAEGYAMPTDAHLWAMLLREWKRDDAPNGEFDGNAPAILGAAATQLDGMKKLAEKLGPAAEKGGFKPEMTAKLESELRALKASPTVTPVDAARLYFRIRIWKRALVLSNPLVKACGPILFVKRRPTSYDHIVMQYFGWRAQRGGGLFVLQNPGYSLECRDILDGKLAGGNVADPCVSWDGKKVVFSWVELKPDGKRYPWQEAWTPYVHNEEEESHHEYYHIYECGTDGTGLRQLTDGCYEDLMPAYLPDGNIVFVSSRRKGHPRCFWWGFGERWSTYTVHKMNADGKNIQPLSWHETNEWYPTVSHDGQIFYARWDYIDRDAVTHQNLWSMRPDGTNPTAVWGNASLDIYATFQAKPVPGSRKWLLTAAAHHSITGGSLVLLDPSVAKDGPQAIERLTPEVPFPEAEGNNIPTFYCSPWPLSEDFCLTSYSPYRLEFEPKPTRDEALGIYVYDRFGNRELLYRDPEIGSDSAQPLAARPTPPVIPSFLPENAPKEGRFFVTDIYQGLGPDVKRGSIKALRVVQIFPKTTIKGNDPAIGLAGEENGRAILGTVPVESDGSANFVAPACKPLLFQALNEKGEAFQTMRTLTYLQPGEEIACIGCHEDRTSAVGGNAPYSVATRAVGGNAPIAAGRAPSKIDPGRLGGRTFSFSETIQPILNAKCVSCHGPAAGTTLPASLKKASEIDLTNAPDGQFSKAYTTLMNRKGLIPRWPQRNRIEVTEPGGENGAIGSGLKKVLADENHKDVKLTDEEWRDLATWIDLNAIFFGTTETEFQKDRLTGKRIPMQTIQ